MRIAIVGGGFSGTLVVVHLLRGARAPLEIRLIERRPPFGPGVAFGGAHPSHLLNVRAKNMSAFPDEPEHFVAWLRKRSGPEQDGDSFAPRREYGEYLTQVLEHARTGALPGIDFRRVTAEAIGIEVQEGEPPVRLTLRGGDVIASDRAVLALGNFPSPDPPVDGPTIHGNRCYVGDPWAPGALDTIGATAPVLLIGTGLTAIDVALTLDAQGHRAPVHVLSRRGLLPELHAKVPPAPPFDYGGPPRVRAMFRAVRERAREAEAQGAGWRSVIDSMRPRTQTLWLSLSVTEQRRFLRHLRSFWDVHRHRLAPEVGAQIDGLRASGRFLVHAARIEGYEPAAGGLLDVRIRRRGTGERAVLRVAYVVNCTGPELDYAHIDHPLVRSLLDRGLARADDLSLGLDATPDGRLFGADGRASPRLFTLGPPLRGRLWETTAVPDIRVQAETLAQALLSGA